MSDQMTLEELRTLAQRAGLRLSENELERLLPGVIRARQQAAALRELIGADDEPAAVFSAARK
jgi:hypothetical protein